MELQGYQFTDRLHQGERCDFWHVQSLETARPQLAKLLARERPEVADFAVLRRELRLKKRFAHTDLLPDFRLIRGGGVAGILYEDAGILPLSLLVERQGSMDVAHFLRLALAFCRQLRLAHEAGLLLCSFHPSRWLWDGEKDILNFLGLDIALDIKGGEQRLPVDLGLDELIYMAPEQRGMIARNPDVGSDLYGLGCLFFYLLSGRQPFRGDSRLELGQEQLANQSLRLQQYKPAIPSTLCQIVDHMLQANPDSRYRSLEVLQQDLQNCQRKIETGSTRGQNIGRREGTPRLAWPERYFGDNAVLTNLREAYMTACTRRSQTVILNGPSHEMQRNLVEELRQTVVINRGLMVVTGGNAEQGSLAEKGDKTGAGQHGRVGQLLAQLACALPAMPGDFRLPGQVLAAVNPQAESWMWHLSPDIARLFDYPVPTTDTEIPSDEQLYSLFGELMDAVVMAGRPLVMVIYHADEMAAADKDAITHLMARGMRNVLLILTQQGPLDAPRNREQLAPVLDSLAAISPEISRLAVPPLDPFQMTAWLASALDLRQEYVEEIAEMLTRKCAPWPEELIRALTALQQSGALWYEPVWQRWAWSLEQVNYLPPQQDKLQSLKQQVAKSQGDLWLVLGAAATLQDVFDLPTIARLTRLDMRHVRRAALEARAAGILLTDKSGLEEEETPGAAHTGFAPDQVLRRALATRLPGDDSVSESADIVDFEDFTRKVWRFSHSDLRRATRQAADITALAPGRLHSLLDSYDQGRIAQDHILETAALVLPAINRLEMSDHSVVIDLLVDAARRCLPGDMAQQDLANACRTAAWALIRPAHWAQDHQRCMTVGMRILKGLNRPEDEDHFHRLQTELFEKCQHEQEYLSLKLMAIDRSAALDQRDRVIDLSLAALTDLGLALSRNPSPAYSIWCNLRAEARIELTAGNVARLSRSMSVGKTTQKMHILGRLLAVLEDIDDPLMAPVSAHMVLLTLKHGWHAFSGLAFACHAAMMSEWAGDHLRAMRLGQFAVDMATGTDASQWRARMCFLNARINQRRGNAAQAMYLLTQGAQDDGDRKARGWRILCQSEHLVYRLFTGTPLDELQPNLDALDLSIRDLPAGHRLRRIHDMFAGLMRNMNQPFIDLQMVKLDGSFDGRETESQARMFDRASDLGALFHYCLTGQFDQAVDILANSQHGLSSTLPGHDDQHWQFFACLTMLMDSGSPASGRWDGKKKLRDPEGLRQVMRALRQSVAREKSMHLPRLLLLRAEWARIEGRLDDGIDLLERAVNTARIYGNFIEEILACLRLADAFNLPAREEERRRAMRFARNAALAWGSAGLAARFEQLYGDDMMNGMRDYHGDALPHKAHGGGHQVIDVEALAQASRIIAGEVRLGELLKKMMRMVTGVAAAERGMLILEYEGQWAIQAELSGGTDTLKVLENQNLSADKLATSVVHYVIRTGEKVVLDDAQRDLTFANDPYLLRQAPKSLLCLPLLNQSSIRAVLYLENSIVHAAFAHSSVDVLSLLSGQMAVSIENARLYDRMERINQQLSEMNINLEQTVTERTAALTDKTVVLESTFETMQDGIMAFDDAGRVREFNSEILRMFALPDDAVTGMGYREIFDGFFRYGVFDDPETDAARIAQEIDSLTGPLVQDPDCLEYAREIRTAHGRNLKLSLRRMKDGDGWIVKCVDVTEDRQRESELRSAMTRAEAANEAKSRFLATMSHEIRTPMNGVIGMIDLLRDTRLDIEQQELAEVVGDSAGNLLGIIDEILDFSKIEAGKLSIDVIEIALRDLVEQVIDLMAAKAISKKIELAVHIDPAIPDRLLADPVRIRQVLINLVGNAVKFTHEGHVALVITIDRNLGDAMALKFDVQDTGVGLTETAQTRLFEAFEQEDASTTRRFGGTGLGLTISKNLVELMGGQIGLHSTPGQGSSFWFTLPFDVPNNQEDEDDGIPDLSGLTVGLAATLPVLQAGLAAELMRRHVHIAVAGSDGWPSADLYILDKDQVGEVVVPESKPVIHLQAGTGLALSGKAGQVLAKPVRRRRLFQEVAIAAGRAMREDFQMARATIRRHFEVPDKETARAAGAMVLVAEDNETNRTVIEKQLKRLGVACDIVHDGEEAWRALQSGSYGLLLSDCHMPALDGYGLTDRIRQYEDANALQRLPVVALTANALAGESMVAIQHGMDDFLSKPVKLDDLEQLLFKWLPELEDLRQPSKDDDLLEAEHAGLFEEESDDALRGPKPEIMDLTLVLSVFGSLDTEALDMIQRFIDITSPAVAELLAIDGEDPEHFRDIAHQVAGAARTAGAVKLATRTIAIEQLLLAGDVIAALDSREDIADIWQEIEAFVKELG